MTRTSDAGARRIVLVGMMGTGKSSVAARVAGALHRECIDVDVLIESRHGRSIGSIFADDGEPAFRAIEAGVVGEVLAAPGDVVVALGGGAVLTPSSRSLLAECEVVVWLRATPAVLARRLAGDATRPLLAGDPLTRLVALSAERDDLYRSVATHVVDVDDLSVDEVVARIVDIAAAATTSPGKRH